MRIGFLLLCGGRSSRMGQSKALLKVGGMPLAERVALAGAGFDERIFSVNDDGIPTPEGFIRVSDLYTLCGPMGGLHAALTQTACDALVVAPCDAPRYSAQLAQYLAQQYTPGVDALILRDDTGKAHPLMGVYARSCLPALEAHLRSERFKLMRMLDSLNTREIVLPAPLSQDIFENLNTPEDLTRFLRG
ncbi:MAG: molybdenum cofactor guanylyltransferase [Clostridia bacterium]|nr:molybdenum cofactor guanylyltransferase [Clostridia bacterium]